jgi:E3 ubiquitin-protein ligase mind-bomb
MGIDGVKCKLCDEDPCSVIFLPCRHKVCCTECSVRLKKCISCNEKIEEKLNSVKGNTSIHVKLDDLLDKIHKLEEAQMCAICMERKKEIAFQCGHIVCGECSIPLIFCHICRQIIVKRIKIYEN